jgi:hypothetical protein
VRPVEQLLVVNEGEIVHQRRHADDLPVDRGRGALAGPEVVPGKATAVDPVGEPDHLGAAGDLRGVGAVQVGDVRVLATGQRGQHLLEGVVVVALELGGHLDVAVAGVELLHQAGDRLGLRVGVTVPQHDLGRRAVGRGGLVSLGSG